MTPMSSRWRLCLLFFVLFVSTARGGHLHRHLRSRQTGSAQSNANDLLSDISKLQQSFSSFGTDLSYYLSSLSFRVSRLEKYLGIDKNIVATSSSSQSVSAVESTSSTTVSMTTTKTVVASGPTSISIITSSNAAATTSNPPVSATSKSTPSTQAAVSTSFTSSSSSSASRNIAPSTFSTSSIPYSSPSHASSSTPSKSSLTSTSASTTTSTPTSASSPPTRPSATISASSSSSTSSQSPTSGAFDPLSTQNLAVYYGQTPQTTADGLLPLCANPAVNIVILAFVPTFFSGTSGMYPTASFGPACHADAARAAAPGLPDCGALGTQIAQCQQTHGTKVLVSLGGYGAASAFASDAQAAAFASTLWDLFGGGRNASTAPLRPFGPDVVVDGFDVDNEDHATAGWAAFATALRKLYASDGGRKYYLSAAPQCPRPDESIPSALYAQADFVWVQFYNNPMCDLDSGAGFLDSAAAWSKDLASGDGKSTSTVKPPRFFIGMGAWPGAGAGYVDGGKLAPIVAQAKSRAAGNFGGIMLWDGSVAAGNGYIAAAKSALKQ